MRKIEHRETTVYYCDVCGNEIQGSRYGMTDNDGKFNDICMGYYNGQSCKEVFLRNRKEGAGDIPLN